MGCGCNKGTDSALEGTVLTQSYATPDSAGLYPLAAAPDCTEPYHGEYANSLMTLYVVALGTSNEQLFRRTDRNDATRLARINRWTLDQVHPKHLCHDVVYAFLGS